MKQITLSNVVAVLAILVCIYSFVGEKATSSVVEKEYCIMRTNASPGLYTIDVTFSNGEQSYQNYTESAKKGDQMMHHFVSKEMAKLSLDGWVLKTQSISTQLTDIITNSYSQKQEATAKVILIDQYVLEREKR